MREEVVHVIDTKYSFIFLMNSFKNGMVQSKLLYFFLFVRKVVEKRNIPLVL